MTQGTSGTPDAEVSLEERRTFVRLRRNVQLSCRVIGEVDDEESVHARNLGTGGVRIPTRQPLPVGTRVQLRAKIPDAGVEFTTGGRVVWSEFNGALGHHEAGICFVGLDPTQRRNVMALIGTHLDMMEGLERRHYIRLGRRVLADYRAARGFFRRWHTVYAPNLSLGGVALVTPRRLRKGTHVEVRLHLDESSRRPVTAAGSVVACTRVEGSGGKKRGREWTVNMRFDQIAEADKAHLAAYISHILTAPSIQSITAPREEKTKGA